MHTGRMAALTLGSCVALLTHYPTLVAPPTSPSTASAPRVADEARVLYIEPINGLANRLRALVAGLSLADALQRRAIIVWTSSVHCRAPFHALFESDYEVWDTPPVSLPRGDVYDMDADKLRVVHARDDRDLYIRSPFVFSAEIAYVDRMRAVFQRLTPAKPVRALMTHVFPDVAVHVRMQQNLTRDVPGLGAVDAASMEVVNAHRARCHWTHFRPVLAHLHATRPDDVIVIDSDTPEAARTLAEGFRAMTLDTPPECFGARARETPCVQQALAHILTLARASHIVGSEWSSYSEVIHWLARPRAQFINGCQWDPALRADVDDAVDVSVLVACRDRDTHETMLRRLVRVMTTTGGSSSSRRTSFEVILVDWSSARRIEVDAALRSVVRLVRVVDQRSWNLAQAYNVALRYARGRVVLKLDCDTRVACAPPPLGARAFATGPSVADAHLTGLVYTHREHIRHIGGYDERFTRYGWDDSDLYIRLESLGLQRTVLSPRCFSHMEHDVQRRGVSSAIEAEIYTQANRLCGLQNAWNASMRVADYREVAHDANLLVQIYRPPGIETSGTCDHRVAVGAVLQKLWRHCTSPHCADRFWRVLKTDWHTVREVFMRLTPARVDLALACMASWGNHSDPRDSAACRATLVAFDRAGRALTRIKP